MARRPAQRNNQQASEWDQKLISLDRVTRVVAGGKRFRFRATLVIGDRKGRVGLGMAKGADASIAIEKAFNKAKKNVRTLPLVDGTVPFAAQAKFKSAQIIVKPAKSGKGIIAGSAARVICDLGGVANIVTKVLSKTTNQINNAKATMAAFEVIDRRMNMTHAQKRLAVIAANKAKAAALEVPATDASSVPAVSAEKKPAPRRTVRKKAVKTEKAA